MSLADGGKRVLLRDDGAVVLAATGIVVLTRADDLPCACCPDTPPPPPRLPCTKPGVGTGPGTLAIDGVILCTTCWDQTYPGMNYGQGQKWQGGTVNGNFEMNAPGTVGIWPLPNEPVMDVWDQARTDPGCGPDPVYGPGPDGTVTGTNATIICVAGANPDGSEDRWELTVGFGCHCLFYGHDGVWDPVARTLTWTNESICDVDASLFSTLACIGVASGGTAVFTFPPP